MFDSTKRLAAFLFLALLVAAPANAATVTFNLYNLISQRQTNQVVTITPISPPFLDGTNLITASSYTTNSGTTGSFTLTDMASASYRVSISTRPRATEFIIQVPNDTNSYSATDVAVVNPPSGPGLPIATLDSRYVKRTNGWATNLYVTNLNANLGNTAVGTYLRRGTNGLPYWDTVTASGGSGELWTTNAALATLSSNNAANLTNWNIFDSNTVSRTIYLATNGNDATARINDRSRPFATITNAFLRVTNNTVLEIMDAGPYIINPSGNFNSDLARPEPLQIVGSSNVLVRGTGNSIIYGAGASNMMLIANSRNVRLEGLTFRNNRAGFDGSPGSLFTAIYMFNTNNYVEVDRCRFEDLGNHGIVFGSVSTADKATFYLTVQNSFFSMVGNSTIRDGTCVAIPRGPSRILNNTFLDCLRPIEFEGVYGALVSSNHIVMGNYIDRYRDIAISHFDDGGTTNNYVDVKIVENLILNGIAETNGGGVGISSTVGANRWEISRNIIRGAADHGITFGAGATHNTKIVGNVIENTGNFAIGSTAGGRGVISNVISGNIINDCDEGINWAGDSNLISANVFNGVVGRALNISGTGNRVKDNQMFYSGAGVGAALVIGSTATNTIVEGNESVGVPLRSPSNLGVATRFINNHEETNQFWFHYGLRESNNVTFASNAVLRGAVQVLDLTGTGDTLSLTASGVIQRTNITGGSTITGGTNITVISDVAHLDIDSAVPFNGQAAQRLDLISIKPVAEGGDGYALYFIDAPLDGLSRVDTNGYDLDVQGTSIAKFRAGAVTLRGAVITNDTATSIPQIVDTTSTNRLVSYRVRGTEVVGIATNGAVALGNSMGLLSANTGSIYVQVSGNNRLSLSGSQSGTIYTATAGGLAADTALTPGNTHAQAAYSFRADVVGAWSLKSNLLVHSTATVTNGFINPIATLSASPVILNFGPTNMAQTLDVSGNITIGTTNRTAGQYVERIVKLKVTSGGPHTITWAEANLHSLPAQTLLTNGTTLLISAGCWGTATNDVLIGTKYFQ